MCPLGTIREADTSRDAVIASHKLRGVGASQEQYLVSSLSRQDFGEMVLDVLDS